MLLDIATAKPVGEYWAESGLVSAALPHGGFLEKAFGELRRRSATGGQLGPALKLGVGGASEAHPVPGGIAVDADTAYAVGAAGAAIVSVPLIDGTLGRSKLGRPGVAAPDRGGVIWGIPCGLRRALSWNLVGASRSPSSWRS